MRFLSKNIPDAIQIENPNCISRFILAAGDHHVRHQGASGGAVSEIIRYLFSAGMVQTAISYHFDNDELFVPHLIYSYEDYRQVGSIYHAIQIAHYLHLNKAAIKGAIVVVCLPCQVAAVRQLLSKSNIPHFIISLFCSGQQKKEATWFYLNNIGVNRKDIVYFSYRGEGWPSGIRITTTDGTQKFDPNVGGNWGKFRTPPFCLRRCMFCKDTFGVNADITAGDPWLKQYMKTETVGVSMVGTLTSKGDAVIHAMIQNGMLILLEEVEDAVFVNSQESAIVGKFIKRNTLLWQRLFYRLSTSRFYHNFILKKHLDWHIKFYKRFRRVDFIFLRIKLIFFGAAR